MAIDPALIYYGTQLINGATTTGAGGDIYHKRPVRNHTIGVVYTDADASITALTVDIEHSLDGTNWNCAASHKFYASELTAKSATFFIVNRPLIRVRANITVLTGAGSGDSIDVYYLWDDLK